MAELTGQEMLNLDFEEEETSSYDEVLWKPENEGDNIIGQYIDLKEQVGQYNSNIYILRDTEDERRSIFGGGNARGVLDDKMKNIPQGTYIKITYNGKKKAKTGNYYKDFSVQKAKGV